MSGGEHDYPEALLERAADAVRRAAMELTAEVVDSTAHLLVVGVIAEALHRGVTLDEAAAGRVELVAALAEVERHHRFMGGPDAGALSAWVTRDAVWESVRRRAITLLRMRGQEEGWYGEVAA